MEKKICCFNFSYKHSRFSLYSVCAGFIHCLSALNIPQNKLFTQRRKGNVCAFMLHPFIRSIANAYAGIHLMHTSAQRPKHFACFPRTLGLAKNFPVHADNGIRCNNNFMDSVMQRLNRICFSLRQFTNHLHRIAGKRLLLVDICLFLQKIQAKLF